MNSLSWFLYAADVLAGMGFLLGVFFFISVVLTIAGIFLYCMTTDGEFSGQKKIDAYAKMNARGATLLKFAIPTCIATGLVGTAVPSKSTMYAIAASQIGERVAANEAVQGLASDATKALQEWIKKQIEPETKK